MLITYNSTTLGTHHNCIFLEDFIRVRSSQNLLQFYLSLGNV
jgi:hypothetical protein